MKILRKLFKREYISKICDFKELFGYIARWKYRNSHQRCSMKKGILRNFAKFTGKHLCQSLSFNKVAGLGLWWLFLYFHVGGKFLGNSQFQKTPIFFEV